MNGVCGAYGAWQILGNTVGKGQLYRDWRGVGCRELSVGEKGPVPFLLLTSVEEPTDIRQSVHASQGHRAGLSGPSSLGGIANVLDLCDRLDRVHDIDPTLGEEVRERVQHLVDVDRPQHQAAPHPLFGRSTSLRADADSPRCSGAPQKNVERPQYRRSRSGVGRYGPAQQCGLATEDRKHSNLGPTAGTQIVRHPFLAT